MKHLKRVLAAWLVIAAALYVISKFVISPYLVVGDSMVPTLHSWDICLMQQVRHYEPRRGDIVTFRTADDPPVYFVKRIIGLPRETVAISNGVVLIDRQPLGESYTTVNPTWELESVLVRDDQVFVMGDNRDVPFEWAFARPVATRLVKARLVWHARWRR